MEKKKVAFICTHNSCRSQIAQALGKHLAGDVFESFSAGTEIKNEINPDAVRLIKEYYGIDMNREQFPKTIDKIPSVDIVVTMGCGVNYPNVYAERKMDWGLEDPTGKSDEEFLEIIKQIEKNVLQLAEQIKNRD